MKRDAIQHRINELDAIALPEFVPMAARLNDARWAACNHRYDRPHTMEEASELADEIIRNFIGLSPEEWSNWMTSLDNAREEA